MASPSSDQVESLEAIRDVELYVFRLRSHGNACAFVFPDATVGVVDWGSKDITPFTKLLDAGASRLRFVVATHAHSDHTKGIELILRKCVQSSIPVEALYYPAIGKPRLGPYDYLNKAAHYAIQNHIRVHPVSVVDFPPGVVQPPPYLARTDSWEVTILAPPSSTNSRHQLTSHWNEKNPGNITSIILLFRYLDNEHASSGRALLPGDATPATLGFAASLAGHYPDLSIDNDAIVIPHHGSRKNWPDWLTQHVRGNAIVSAGPNGRDHPHKDVLRTLSRACAATGGSRLYCTSYSRACREEFASDAPESESLLGHGACFGDIRVRLSRHGSSVVGHDPNGPARRSFGFCSQP